MELRIKRASLRLKHLMLAVFLLLVLDILYLEVSRGTAHRQEFVLGAVGAAAVLLLLPPIFPALTRLGSLKIWLLLSLLCLTVKAVWVLLVQVPLAGDYLVFWDYANSLASREVVWGGRYLALFPHIFGYADFLSWFIRLFGPSSMLAQWLNVVLSVCAGSLLFLLGCRWFGLTAGAGAYLFWIACPSQTMYNSLVLSEPLYTVMLLAFLLAVTELSRRAGQFRRPVRTGACSGLGCALLLRWLNGVRPIAAILAIAMFLWVLLLNTGCLMERDWRRLWLPFLAVLVAAYLLTGPLWNGHIARRIGEEPSTTPGYSVLVGFNGASGGRWNQEDSDRLYTYSDQPGATAQWAQEQALNDALARITSGRIDFPALLQDKLHTFLGADDACVGYSAAALGHMRRYFFLCNGFYYACLFLALAGTVRLWRQKTGTIALMAPLYVLGLTSAQMLVEVAGRYHYSALPMLMLMAQAAISDRRGVRSGADGCPERDYKRKKETVDG